MNFANAIFAVFSLLSLAIVLWQWLAAREFPLHRKIARPDFSPAVTLLKPLKGCDETTAVSLRSWFCQQYPGKIQLLFGVGSAEDPVCAIVRSLIAENPHCDAELVICERLHGENAKVAKLAQLEKLAKYDLILVSDADVRVPADFLANVVAPLHDEQIGLVNCFYRLANPTTVAMRWEAIAVNADFWSQVLQSKTLKPLDFALGAVMLTRRKRLAEIGGFQSLAFCLADDFQLGNRIVKNGHGIALCPIVVECWDAPAAWTQVWRHQLRWARTIRVSQPLPYFFSILANAGLWSLVWLACELATATAHNITLSSGRAGATVVAVPVGLLVALVCLVTRIFLVQNLQRRFTPGGGLISPFWLVPVKDVLQAALWLGAFSGNTIEWRGRRMKLQPDGTLVAKKINPA